MLTWIFARRFHVCFRAVVGAAVRAGADGDPRVLNGIDVLREQNFEPLAGKRVGLITNHTGLAADGTTTIDLLFRSKICRLVALFSPEHGIRGTMDSKVNSSVDESTSLPIYSLYGDTKTADRRNAPRDRRSGFRYSGHRCAILYLHHHHGILHGGGGKGKYPILCFGSSESHRWLAR